MICAPVTYASRRGGVAGAYVIFLADTYKSKPDAMKAMKGMSECMA